MEIENLNRFALLGHPQRMAILRLLIRRYPDKVSAGELGHALEQRASTMSSYLASLAGADLIEQHREGTSRLYRVRLENVRAMTDYLLLDCCRGRPDLCAPTHQSTEQVNDKSNVLFVCTGNTARSIFAEALLKKLGADRFNAYSAGTAPKSELNSFALETLVTQGHDIAGLRSKNVSEFHGPNAPKMDFVFTVCDRAANEECPVWPGQPIAAHWGQSDPVSVIGSLADQRQAFAKTYRKLNDRIEAFVSLPMATLNQPSRQLAVDAIALESN